MPDRPVPPPRAAEGLVYTPQPDPGWSLAGPDRRCRYQAGGNAKACGKPAVAALDRGTRGPRVYHYCADCVGRYGRWVQDGQVWHWVLRAAVGPAAETQPAETRDQALQRLTAEVGRLHAMRHRVLALAGRLDTTGDGIARSAAREIRAAVDGGDHA